MKMIHLRIFFGVVLLSGFFFHFMSFIFHSIVLETRKEETKQPIHANARPMPLLILTPRPKHRPITVSSSKSTFIMLEARHISDRLGLVFWTLINAAYFELTHNWLCQTSSMIGVHERVFIVTTDENTASKLRKYWPDISILSMKSNLFNSSLTWGQREYNDFLILRASFIRLFVDNDVPFVLFETDSIWIRNPLEYFQNHTRSAADMITPEKYASDKYGRKLTFSPMLILANKRTKRFMKELYSRLLYPKSTNGTLYDQDVIDDMCNEKYADTRCLTFPWPDVADGHWFKLSEKRKSSLSPYIINNNFYSGVQNKITRQALNSFWYLTVDKACDYGKVNGINAV